MSSAEMASDEATAGGTNPPPAVNEAADPTKVPETVQEAKRVARDPEAKPAELLKAAQTLGFVGAFDDARMCLARLESTDEFRTERRQLKFAIDRLSDMTPDFQDYLLVNTLQLVRDPASTNDQLINAADRLIRWGSLDAAERAMDVLEQRGERRFLPQMRAVSRQLRRSGVLNTFEVIGQPMVGQLDRPYEAMLARHPGGSHRTIIVFTGAARRFWMSINVLHHFLKRYGANILYLSDHRGQMYLTGLTGLDGGYAGMVQMLSTQLSELGATDVYVMASSAGGFVGLMAASDLKAEAYLGLSIRTDLTGRLPRGAYIDRAIEKARAPQMVTNLRPFIEARSTPRRIYLCCGDAHEVDYQHVANLTGLPNVHLRLLPGTSIHDVTPVLLSSGLFEKLLDELMGPSAEKVAVTA